MYSWFCDGLLFITVQTLKFFNFVPFLQTSQKIVTKQYIGTKKEQKMATKKHRINWKNCLKDLFHLHRECIPFWRTSSCTISCTEEGSGNFINHSLLLICKEMLPWMAPAVLHQEKQQIKQTADQQRRQACCLVAYKCQISHQPILIGA